MMIILRLWQELAGKRDLSIPVKSYSYFDNRIEINPLPAMALLSIFPDQMRDTVKVVRGPKNF